MHPEVAHLGDRHPEHLGPGGAGVGAQLGPGGAGWGLSE